jgi:uncharacterized protein (UPF0332 family)
MHHCARAALFKSGGVGKSRDVPESHEHVIQHFGRLEDASGKVGGLGMMLNRARGERVASDYDLDDEITDEQASETAADAVHFVEQCRKLWNLESLD